MDGHVDDVDVDTERISREQFAQKELVVARDLERVVEPTVIVEDGPPWKVAG